MALVATIGLSCGGSDNAPGGGTERVEGQSDFVSSPPPGSGLSARDSAGGTTGSGGGGGAGGTGTGTPPPSTPTGGNGPGTTPDRQVEETDLYRVEGDRLYYINGYRGLMVFDISDISAPKLLGRSPIFGSPVEMVVRNGMAVVVVADWYGRMDDGAPFHGSVVRGLDATDPTNIRLVGEAKLGGWVSDTRVVGDVIYAVSEEYNWSYGWGTGGDTTDSTGGTGGGVGTSGPGVSTSKSVVSSVSFAGGEIRSVGRYDVPGYGGIFNVTANSILFAHDVAPANSAPDRYTPSTDMQLDYVDISDPGGNIVPRGHVQFTGHVPTWGTDNGRWNLDFADGKMAHIAACGGQYCGEGLYLLATVDFSNPDAPAVRSKISLPTTSYSAAVRFDRGRMYLAPGSGYSGTVTPIQVFDLADPAAPKLAGQTQIAGSVWNFTPAGDRLFTLGNERDSLGFYGSKISVSYLDVSDPARPVAIGAPATFGEGWAWTPAAGTFKAFTKSDTEGLVVLPFSGYSYNYRQYNNGLQLIEFTPTSIKTSGAARTKGWVERGVFVKGKLVSLSDTSLAVVDYANRAEPKVVAELTLARNVVDAQPHGANVALLSSDWYSYDHDRSELRLLPIDKADETVSDAALAEVSIEGVNARVYHNGELSYVVTNVESEVPCPTSTGGDTPGSGGAPGKPGDATAKCWRWREQVQVVDFSSGSAVLRGKIALPDLGYYSYYGMGFGGCYAGDWYYGDSSVQVGGDVLAFRRWAPTYWNGNYVDSHGSLFIVDLSDPDSPGIASTVITRDKDGWWGNMRAIGNTLYTSHYEWHQRPAYPTTRVDYIPSPGYVRYYLDRIDLSDRKKPRVGSSINVPGMLVGGSETDPSLLYTVDYRWMNNRETSEFDVVKIRDGKAYLQSSLAITGSPGSTFVRGDKAYMSVQQYLGADYSKPAMKLAQLDLSNPKSIVLRTSEQKKGWGWLLGVEGDRALVTSGWGSDGLDIYKLTDGEPAFDQFVRTLGYSARSTSRQGDQIFLASGQWGVQTVNLK